MKAFLEAWGRDFRPRAQPKATTPGTHAKLVRLLRFTTQTQDYRDAGHLPRSGEGKSSGISADGELVISGGYRRNANRATRQSPSICSRFRGHKQPPGRPASSLLGENYDPGICAQHDHVEFPIRVQIAHRDTGFGRSEYWQLNRQTRLESPVSETQQHAKFCYPF